MTERAHSEKSILGADTTCRQRFISVKMQLQQQQQQILLKIGK